MPEEEELGTLRGYILIETTPEGRVEDNFQLCVRGDPHIKLQFSASQLLPIPELAAYHLHLDTPAEELLFTENQTTSPWLDLQELVEKRSVTVTKNNSDATEEFLTTLQVNKLE